MRWKLWLGLTASLAACRETVVLDEGPFDGGGTGFDGGPPNCGTPASFTPRTPTVMVALDRSDSMLQPFGYGTALAVTRDALDKYATANQKATLFGYLDFPGTSFCSSQTCCIGKGSPPNRQFANFSAALHACDLTQSCGTPTGTQRPTSAAFSSFDFTFSMNEPNQYVLLITNGRPDCGSGTVSGSCGDGAQTENEIAGLFNKKNVRTYVVAPGQTGLDTCFNDLAAAGATGGSRTPQDPSDLDRDIGDILHTIATDTCDLDLSTQIRDSSRVQFYWKGMQIPRDTGWDIAGNGYTVILRGNWCESLIKDGKTDDFQLYTNCPSPPHP
jgi:hypothetical protein